MNEIPRSEYPDPQFQREDWINLNGEWDFEFDFGVDGADAGFLEKEKWSKKITVPFCPESKLSGIGYRGFIPAVWYRRRIALTAGELKKRVFIRFGAVDYRARLYVNGKEAGVHKGGYSPFKVEITDYLSEGVNTIILNAWDDARDPLVPRGKQSEKLRSHDCDYTRTTGIWQTVWLEFVPKSYIEGFRLYPDALNGTLFIYARLKGEGEFTARAFYGGKEEGSFRKTAAGAAFGEIKLGEKRLWEVGAGRLYDLELTFGEDRVGSYFGLRNVRLDGYKFLINEKPVFQRLVLDQGFYHDGIYTAPDDAALANDVKISLDAGFNGARLHQKAFEPRFLYRCDKAGYIVWGEYPNWGLDHSDPRALEAVLPEWSEIVERDFNRPSIIGWCPFNETWDVNGRKQDDEVLRNIYRITKALDPTRPCIDASGNYHVETDVYDVHDYEQDPAVFRARSERFAETGELYEKFPGRQQYNGEPTFVSEFGGMKRSEDGCTDAWGYGETPKTKEEFIERYKALADALLDNPRTFGFCYTQLYDVEQERNGLYTFRRVPKFDMETLKKINSRAAAVEKEP